MHQHGRSAPLYREGPISRANVVKREKELKGWSRKKKQELIAKASEQITRACPEQSEGSPAPGAIAIIRADFFPKKSALIIMILACVS